MLIHLKDAIKILKIIKNNPLLSYNKDFINSFLVIILNSLRYYSLNQRIKLYNEISEYIENWKKYEIKGGFNLIFQTYGFSLFCNLLNNINKGLDGQKLYNEPFYSLKDLEKIKEKDNV